MNRRMIIVGMIAGLLKAATLIIPFYLFAPATYSDTWITLNVSETLRKTSYIPDVFITVVAGYSAARFGWATSRQIQAGLLAGVLSGMVAWLLIGSGTASVAGSGPMLMNGLTSSSVLESNVSIVWWLHLSFWGMVIPGAFFGMLGGWLAQRHNKPHWGNQPDPIHPTIWKALGITILLLAIIQVYRSVKTYSRVAADITTTAIDNTIALPLPPYGVFAWPAGAALTALIVSAWWNWHWIATQWHATDIRSRRNAWSAAGFNLLLPIVIFVELGQDSWSSYTMPVLLTGVAGFALVSLLGIYRTWRGPAATNAHPAAAHPANESAAKHGTPVDGDAASETQPDEALPPSMQDWYDYLMAGWPLCASLIMLSSQSISITIDILLRNAQQDMFVVTTTINELFQTHTLGGIGVVGIPIIFALLFSFYSWLSNLVIARQPES